MNQLWEKLCSEDALIAGWGLTRNEMNRDFIEECYSKESFDCFLTQNIQELLRLLQTDEYRPNSLIRIPIPKGSLATRPGTYLSIEDRTVLFAVVNLIARPIDKELCDGVYSYRVKNGSNSNSLFRESNITSIPKLKNRPQKNVDPFEPWYELWPSFDRSSRKAYAVDNYRYLVTSDIAAYFENIQLDMLRDQLNSLLPEEPKIVNLVFEFLNSWTYDTIHGRRYLRGIPQGSQISSFFGNIFLKPIDDIFEQYKLGNDIEYFRYMDDIRIFTKDIENVRSSVLLLDAEIRRLHLNLQNAKTKIFDENLNEISTALFDQRLSNLDDLQNQIYATAKIAKMTQTKPNFSIVHKRLRSVAQQRPKSVNEQKIFGAKKPLRGLSDRVFRRLIAMHLSIGSDELVDRLILELKKNPDFRLGVKLIQCFRKFPRKKKCQTSLLNFLRSNENKFPFQEAQILKSLRYQSRLGKDTIEYAKDRAETENIEDCIRVEAIRLLSRSELNSSAFRLINEIYMESSSVSVKKACALVLIRQRGKQLESFIRELVFHTNDDIRKLGRYLEFIMMDRNAVRKLLKQACRYDHLLVDYLPLLYLIIESKKIEIVQVLVSKLTTKNIHETHTNMDMRERCSELLRFAKQNLSNLPT